MRLVKFMLKLSFLILYYKVFSVLMCEASH